MTSSHSEWRGAELQTVLLTSAFTCVQEAELVMEHAQHFTVPRCIMGTDGRLKVFAPHRRASRAHLEGDQLIHTWNTGEVRADDTDTCAHAGGGAYRPPPVAPSGGSREQDRSPGCPVTSASGWPWRCTLISRLGPGPGLPGHLPAENNCLRVEEEEGAGPRGEPCHYGTGRKTLSEEEPSHRISRCGTLCSGRRTPQSSIQSAVSGRSAGESSHWSVSGKQRFVPDERCRSGTHKRLFPSAEEPRRRAREAADRK